MRLVLGRSTPAIRAIPGPLSLVLSSWSVLGLRPKDQAPRTSLALPLLVLLVRANHAHDAAAPDDFALVADSLHRRSHFHVAPARLNPSLQLFDNPPPADIGRRELQPHLVADQDPHEVALDPIRDVRHHQRPRVEPHLVECARQGLHDHAAYLRAASRGATGTSLAVRIHGPSAVTATVCSKCADRLPSRVAAVQPSASTFTAGFPAFTIGSIASTMPSVSRGPRPGSP